MSEALTQEEIRILKAIAQGFLNAQGGRASSNGSARSNGAASSGAVADDADLDSKWGDEEIKRKDPKGWNGPSFVGSRMSECPSDYLRAFATWKDKCAYMGQKDLDEGKVAASDVEKKEKYVSYDRKSAARARGWAIRNEGKVVQPPLPATGGSVVDDPYGHGDADDIPFIHAGSVAARSLRQRWERW